MSQGYLENIDRVDQETRDMRIKLEEKRQAAIAYLGEKWIMHSCHAPVNSRTPVSMLSAAHAS